MTDQEIADVYYTPGAAGGFQEPVKLYQSLRKKMCQHYSSRCYKMVESSGCLHNESYGSS